MESHSEKSLIGLFLESLAAEKGYSDQTIRAYRKDLEAFFAFIAQSQAAITGRKKHGRTVSPQQIDGIRIRSYLGFLHRQNKKTTIARKLSAIRSFFRFLVKRGLISENPAELVLTPKQDKTIPVYLSVDEKNRQRQLRRLQSQLMRAKEPESLNAQATVYVLVEYIKHPEASAAELSKAVEKKEVKASPEAITRLFKEHDFKKTPM